MECWNCNSCFGIRLVTILGASPSEGARRCGRANSIIFTENNQAQVSKHESHRRVDLCESCNLAVFPSLLERRGVAHDVHLEIVLHPDEVLEVLGLCVSGRSDDDGLEELTGWSEAWQEDGWEVWVWVGRNDVDLFLQRWDGSIITLV